MGGRKKHRAKNFCTKLPKQAIWIFFLLLLEGQVLLSKALVFNHCFKNLPLSRASCCTQNHRSASHLRHAGLTKNTQTKISGELKTGERHKFGNCSKTKTHIYPPPPADKLQRQLGEEETSAKCRATLWEAGWEAADGFLRWQHLGLCVLNVWP